MMMTEQVANGQKQMRRDSGTFYKQIFSLTFLMRLESECEQSRGPMFRHRLHGHLQRFRCRDRQLFVLDKTIESQERIN